jgi:dUTP pyrophosphatase
MSCTKKEVLKARIKKYAEAFGYESLTDDERAFLDGHITYKEYLYGSEDGGDAESIEGLLEPILSGLESALDAITPKMYNTVFNDGSNLQRKNATDAGADVKAAEQVVIPPWGKKLVKTGLYVAIPKGFMGLLWSRSGMAAKYDVEVGAGCIDAPYRGEVKVLLRNFSNDVVIVEHGSRIAQLLITPVLLTPWQDVRHLQDLGETDRGEGGFGSTGK